MGVLGRYIDLLPDEAKDRIIEAQDWCVADVIGDRRARCLIGHAEDWQKNQACGDWWSAETWAKLTKECSAADHEILYACSREFFAFRRMQPLDFDVYRRRVTEWGLASESRIGSRFDRLAARRGMANAVRLAKQRAARTHVLEPLAVPERPAEAAPKVASE
jgi:hypothetical protein